MLTKSLNQHMNSTVMFTLFPNYGLVHIQECGAPTFFTNEIEQEFAQGFVWAPSDVSFMLPRDRIDVDATHENMAVTVAVADSFTPVPEAVRIIRVPFAVSSLERIIVSDLSDDFVVIVPQGQYDLHFEGGYTMPSAPYTTIESCWCRLTFVKSLSSSKARVLKTEMPFTEPLVLRSERVVPETIRRE